MDPSALIFVALAVAWAVYLIPKALEHHEESARTRTVERFSATLRVLARREPVNRRKARLVRARRADASSSTVEVPTDPTSSRRPAAAKPAPAEARTPGRGHREAAARAARRRLRVVTLILLANAVVAALAWFRVVEWVWTAVPVGVLVAWLVACRLMVRRERAQRPRRRIPAETRPQRPDVADDATGEIQRIDAAMSDDVSVATDPDSWDPVPMTLPTYVSKPVAPRSVSTIDLDSTGVWSSGRSAADSALAREAEAAGAATRTTTGAAERRAAGS